MCMFAKELHVYKITSVRGRLLRRGPWTLTLKGQTFPIHIVSVLSPIRPTSIFF